MMKGWLVYRLATSDYVIGWELGACRVFLEKRAAIKWWREWRQEAFDDGTLYSDDSFDKEDQEARIQDGEKPDPEEFDDLLWGELGERNEGMEQILWEEVEIETGIDQQTIDILRDAGQEYESLAAALEGDPDAKKIQELNEDRATAISVVLEAIREKE